MSPISVGIILVVGLGLFTFSLIRKGTPLFKHAKTIDHFNNYYKRFGNLFTLALGQKRFFKKDGSSGFLHAIIFWGFLVISLRTIILFAIGFDASFEFPFLFEWFEHFYIFTLDLFETLVMISVIALFYRRIIIKPKRITISAEGYFILAAIFLLMKTDFAMNSSLIVLGELAPSPYNFMGILGAKYISIFGFSDDFLHTIVNISYFSHIIIILAFLNFLPYGKHFHIITFAPNVFFKKVESGGAIDPINLEDETATSFGANKIEDFDWKQYLDLHSCTECGRCMQECPATATGKELNPKELIINLRNHLNEFQDQLGNENSTRPNLAGDVVSSNVFWACTTCKACEEACPIAIEHVDKIIELRRHKVLMEGDFPTEAQNTMRNIETNSNPWGISYNDRTKWTEGYNVPIMADSSDIEYLYFVGCAGSFDERNKKIAQAFVTLLNKANVSFGILGVEEKCTGDSARRVGNEYLFQTLAKDNIALFAKYNVKKILTACPHCYNTLKNEYPQFGGNYEVIHHTDFLLQLINEKRLTPKSIASDDPNASGAPLEITYHDSCYLGRYNDIYKAPREILEAVGAIVKEPELYGEFGRCCGAGGGQMWMEETEGTRVNVKRMEDLKATGAKTVATGCPFCLTMLGDAAKEEGTMQTKDVAEILAESL